MRGRSPTRVYPQSGRISALAGREGRLRACTRYVQPED
ncbi:replication protein RepA4 [Shigella flexneri]|nr:replication protein RepA4 [Shigella boydii]EFV8922575.1 replication protein RepA4 [Shigella flexneri]EAA2954151.1 replication protein RepA4 [Shigella boydii]EFP9950826.1 replication protein RepA4 [Shigella boydii]EFV9220433.1 replication protein RepA4 [Shigella boydii]